MGVRGLQTFLKNNPHLSQRYELTNTNLLIDGSNLQCNIYHVLCRDENSDHIYCDKYGGDFVAYGQAVREFFKALQLCNIKPILVYDGSVIGKQSTQDQIVLKEKETHRRGLDKFNLALQITEDSRDDSFIMSSLIGSVFKAIVSELGYQTIQSPYEADTHLARLANEMNCPILTNDSDFIIYSLPVGFIILDMFYYKKPIKHKTINRYSIECFVYSQQKLIQFLPGLHKDVLPLVSILLGNDYIASGTFDRVTYPICNRPYQGAFTTATRNHGKIANLLEWLKGISLEEAVEYIVRYSNSRNRDNLRSAIRVLLHSYRIERTDNFVTELHEVYPPINDPKNKTPPELMPATYLGALYEKGHISSVVLDMIFHNTHYSYLGIDDLSLPSSSITIKYRPFSLALTLLRPRTYQGLTTVRRQEEIYRDSYRVFDRFNGEYAMKLIAPMEFLENFGSLEHLTLYSMLTLEPELKRSLLFETFRFNTEELNLVTDTLAQVFLEPFINEARICFLLVKYTGLETKLNAKPQFVDALMLALFFYAALDGKLNPKLEKQQKQYGQLLLKLKPHSKKKNGLRYEPSETIFRRINHFINQLQSAYVGWGLLNGLLGYVLPRQKVERFFNGVLIFRLTKLLRTKEMKMYTLCQDLPIFLDVCNSMKVIVGCDE